MRTFGPREQIVHRTLRSNFRPSVRSPPPHFGAPFQTFITFVDLPHLGKTPWETPFGEVTEGMDTVVDKLYTGYGDQKPFNEDGVDQGVLQQRGNEYLRWVCVAVYRSSASDVQFGSLFLHQAMNGRQR